MAPRSIHRKVAGASSLKRAAGEAPGREGPAPPQASPGRGLTRSSRSRPGVRLVPGCASASLSHLLGRAGLGSRLGRRLALGLQRGGSLLPGFANPLTAEAESRFPRAEGQSVCHCKTVGKRVFFFFRRGIRGLVVVVGGDVDAWKNSLEESFFLITISLYRFLPFMFSNPHCHLVNTSRRHNIVSGISSNVVNNW